MSPKSRGRPPGRGRKKQQRRSPSARASGAPGAVKPAHLRLVGPDETVTGNEEADYWFDEPVPGDRRSWAIPSAHGTYGEIELKTLDPDDEDDLRLLMDARHPEFEDALRNHEEMTVDGETFNPTLHVTMHHIVARQLLANDPPQTWQTVQRLAGLGYDWHNIMHMIAALAVEDIHRATIERTPFDSADYTRRLNALPGDWPPPE